MLFQIETRKKDHQSPENEFNKKIEEFLQNLADENFVEAAKCLNPPNK